MLVDVHNVQLPFFLHILQLGQISKVLGNVCAQNQSGYKLFVFGMITRLRNEVKSRVFLKYFP